MLLIRLRIVAAPPTPGLGELDFLRGELIAVADIIVDICRGALCDAPFGGRLLLFFLLLGRHIRYYRQVCAPSPGGIQEVFRVEVRIVDLVGSVGIDRL